MFCSPQFSFLSIYQLFHKVRFKHVVFIHLACLYKQLVHILYLHHLTEVPVNSPSARCSVSSVGHQMANLNVVAPPLYLDALFRAYLSQEKSQRCHIQHPLARLFMPYLCLQNTEHGCRISDLYLTLCEYPCNI